MCYFEIETPRNVSLRKAAENYHLEESLRESIYTPLLASRCRWKSHFEDTPPKKYFWKAFLRTASEIPSTSISHANGLHRKTNVRKSFRKSTLENPHLQNHLHSKICPHAAVSDDLTLKNLLRLNPIEKVILKTITENHLETPSRHCLRRSILEKPISKNAFQKGNPENPTWKITEEIVSKKVSTRHC